MGGEYLPDLLPNEVEIARVVLKSTTMDVQSIRARRTKHRIIYRIGVANTGKSRSRAIPSSWLRSSSRKPSTWPAGASCCGRGWKRCGRHCHPQTVRLTEGDRSAWRSAERRPGDDARPGACGSCLPRHATLLCVVAPLEGRQARQPQMQGGVSRVEPPARSLQPSHVLGWGSRAADRERSPGDSEGGPACRVRGSAERGGDAGEGGAVNPRTCDVTANRSQRGRAR